MHSVLVRNYRYKYSREGIVPGTWYLEFLLDPCSVSLGYFAMDYEIMTVTAFVTELHDQDGVVDDSWVPRRKGEYWLFTLDEDIPVWTPEEITESFDKRISTNLLIIPRHSTLVIDGTEYNNRYVRDHLNDLRVLLDRIRTDALLEDMDA